MLNNFIKILSIPCLFFLSSCQKNQISEAIIFDNKKLAKININAEIKQINDLYDIKFTEPYTEHVMSTTPSERLSLWLEENILTFGLGNKLEININQASITRTELNETSKKNLIENKEYVYEIILKINFVLYDDYNSIIATIDSEVKRTTTSVDYISLSERNRTLNLLTFYALNDLSIKSVELIKKHMSEYVI